MSRKRWMRDREPTVEDVLEEISSTAAQLRTEADKVTASHLSMEDIAARLESLVDRLREPDPTERRGG